MRFKVGIALHQSKAIVSHHNILILLIKGTLHNQQKKIQHMNGPTILDGLHNSRRATTIAGPIFYQGTS